MDNIILVAILVLIVGAATLYIIRAKKRGTRCIGCPADCGGSCHACEKKE